MITGLIDSTFFCLDAPRPLFLTVIAVHVLCSPPVYIRTLSFTNIRTRLIDSYTNNNDMNSNLIKIVFKLTIELKSLHYLFTGLNTRLLIIIQINIPCSFV